MQKIFNIGNYQQVVRIENGQVQEILCNCVWGTLHADNFQEGKQICRHIKEVMRKDKQKKLEWNSLKKRKEC